ncbi:hypothetical protein STEG23_028856, partial [Scotinomys teguina]
MQMKLPAPSEEDGYHKGPKRVTVLRTTKPFIYDTTRGKMFHATVATETEFFRVMVFEEKLKKMFARRNPITFTDYFGSNGSLMIHKVSSVSAAADSSQMSISKTFKDHIRATPKIDGLRSQTREVLVYGDFKICGKSNGNNCILYVIKDSTGEMEVVVSGHLINVNCMIGDTVRLVCFELTAKVDAWFLRSVRKRATKNEEKQNRTRKVGLSIILEIMNKYKTIVLQKGLEDVAVDDYQFRKIKSLLRKELKLTKKMQDDYDRIQIADAMEDKFPRDAGLDKLIEVCQRIKELEDLAKKLKIERAKVKGKTPLRKRKQEASPDTPTSTTSNTSASDGGETSTAQNEKTQTQTQSTNRGAVLQKDDITVMVLNAIDPFEYKSSEHGGKKMFHATVATVNDYFHVKVFNIILKEKFKKGNIIVISNYIKFKGILEINEASSVSEADPDQKIEVPKNLIRRANETPQIRHIHKGVSGTLLYGLFTLHKKKVNPKNTIYEIKDDTGNIEVVGNGKWYNINCEEGDKLRLFCFQLKTIDKQLKLVSGDHSFIK